MHGREFPNKFRNVFCEYVRLFSHIWNFNGNGFFFFLYVYMEFGISTVMVSFQLVNICLLHF